MTLCYVITVCTDVDRYSTGRHVKTFAYFQKTFVYHLNKVSTKIIIPACTSIT
jgi:hypothetical protein